MPQFLSTLFQVTKQKLTRQTSALFLVLLLVVPGHYNTLSLLRALLINLLLSPILKYRTSHYQ